jgi:hypothetical protein
VDALDVLKVCLRRWYVVLPVLLLSLAAGLGLASQQQPTYTAAGSYALVYHSPAKVKEGEDPTGPNPLATDGAVVLGEALVADFMSGASQATYGGVGNSGTAPREPKDGTSYTVDLPEGSQSYVVQTWGKDPDSLRRVVDSVLAAAPERAAQIQDRAGAPTKSQYTTFVTGPTQLTKLPTTSIPKLIIAMLGVGILAGSALSLVVDRLVQSRKNSAARRPEAHKPSIDEAPSNAYSSEIVTMVPTTSAAARSSENEPEPAMAAVAGFTTTEGDIEAMEASRNTATRLPVAEVAQATFADQVEQVPADLSESVSMVQLDPTSEASADQTREIPVWSAAAVPADQPEETQAADVPADQGAGRPSDATEEQSPVNHINGQQRHDVAPQPVTEHTAEPDFASMDDESIPDNDPWPLLEHQQELDADGVGHHHTRDRQSIH